MLVIVAYDVNTEDTEGARRLRKVAKECVAKGQRVQKSVFECLLDEAQYLQMKHNLALIIDPEKDNLRFYRLGDNYNARIETLGIKKSYDPGDVMIV